MKTALYVAYQITFIYLIYMSYALLGLFPITLIVFVFMSSNIIFLIFKDFIKKQNDINKLIGKRIEIISEQNDKLIDIVKAQDDLMGFIKMQDNMLNSFMINQEEDE